VDFAIPFSEDSFLKSLVLSFLPPYNISTGNQYVKAEKREALASPMAKGCFSYKWDNAFLYPDIYVIIKKI
jgi:hypothetical protein